ncbi:MAG: hypothetical protein J0H23_14370 [Micrococcales bacterium]|nr:hypothetical protein [Micrococcales bacterium]OJX68932.1 MAG: hypothetical protein BGO94_10055 [Micrococcales bacterium 72-143]
MVTNRRERLGAAAVVGALALGLAACTAPEPSHSPWAAEFEEARQYAVNDFQREVLSDDVITEAEYRETRQRYIDCLADAGIKAEALDNGGYNVYSNLAGTLVDAEKACSTQTIGGIEALYGASHVNPRHEDFTKLILQCLRKAGITDDSFTTEDWQALNDEYYPVTDDSKIPPDFPDGTPLTDPRVDQCTSNPLGL